jgi:hypothetical protein
MVTRKVVVEQVVSVSADETKFTPEFMTQFREYMYHFTSLDDHLEHLAQLHARGLVDEFSFIEGYGPAKDMGITFKVTDVLHEIVRE